MMKEDITFVYYPGHRVELELEYDLITSEDKFPMRREIDPNKLTPWTRKRLWAYVLSRGWYTEEHTSWFESGFGYDCSESTSFVPCDESQGTFEAKRHLLYLLLDKASANAYYRLQLIDRVAELESELLYFRKEIAELEREATE